MSWGCAVYGIVFDIDGMLFEFLKYWKKILRVLCYLKNIFWCTYKISGGRGVVCLVRHSPPGMPSGFVRIINFFFRCQGFRMITFDRQAGPLQNFNRSHGHRKKCIVFRPRATPGCGRGAPQTPQNAFQNPRNIFEKQNLVGKKT